MGTVQKQAKKIKARLQPVLPKLCQMVINKLTLAVGAMIEAQTPNTSRLFFKYVILNFKTNQDERGMMGRFVAPRAVQPIVFLLPHFWPSGGVKVYLAIATELARRGHPIVLAACEPDGALRASVPSEIEIVDLPASSAWWARVAPLRAELRSELPFLLPVILELKLHPETLLAPPITVQISQPC